MERIGDDELISIFNKLFKEDDRKSFLQVSRKFMKAACMRVCELQIWSPDMLFDILPASPNLVTFRCYKLLSYNHMKLLAQSCPKLSNLYLSLYYDDDDNDNDSDYYYDDAYFEFDDGLCEVANACRDLLQVDLSDRPNVGDVGVASLIRSCKDLTVLILNGCIGVTDKSLKAIGEASGLHDLDLRGCCITDLGLQCLAYGKVKNNLRYLHLGRCGADVTDIGVVHLLSELPNIETVENQIVNTLSKLTRAWKKKTQWTTL